MAYFYMPLFFSILSYGVVYFMTSDMIGVATSAASLFMTSSELTFSYGEEFDNLFHPGSVEVSEDNTVEYSSIAVPSFGDLYAYVRCSSIGLDVPVFWGNSYYILKRGVAHFSRSYLPGQGDLVFLGAHNNTYFNCLQYIKNDDVIEIETSYGLYTYKVYKTEIIDDISGMQVYHFKPKDGIEDLVLLTCYPFNRLSHTNRRFMVYADLISGPRIVDTKGGTS